MQDTIRIRGAREHNLKNVHIDIPRNKLVVITGLSGSGKSSLAFDTLYAEGQRRYVESLSTYARQFLQLMQKPDVDSIEGLSPAIAIEQKTTSKNPRSTVGTVTELYDYMRLLFARIGVPHSPTTGLPIDAQTVSQMVDRILAMPEKSKILLMAPIVRDRKGEYKKELLDLQKKGFQRVFIDSKVYTIEETPVLNKKVKHTIAVVVDRLVINNPEELKTRLADSIETSLQLSNGLLWVQDATSQEMTTYSSKFACPVSGFTLEEIEPRLFSFNSPQGACPTCDGLGIEIIFDEQIVVPNHDLSLRDGAIAPWSAQEDLATSKRGQITYEYYAQVLEGIANYYSESTTVPFRELSADLRKTLLYGSGDKIIPIVYNDGARKYISKKPFEGIIPNLKRRWLETESDWTREFLRRFQNETPCHSCNGHRLKDEALCVKIAKLHIGEVGMFSINNALSWFENIELSKKHQEIADKVLKEIRNRLKFLVDVGLGYLTLARNAGTLSGGESQRIRLASQVGSGLTGVLYVLDEPSIGLHQRDNDRLLDSLRNLRDLGNTVVVVEHDEDAILTADWVIDMGPAAGIHGGEVISQGTPKEIIACTKSLTGQYLKGTKSIPLPTKRRSGHKDKFLHLKGAKSNNLKNVDITLPLGTFTCVTGVSGGGKSTLIIETLYKALNRQFNYGRDLPGIHQSLEGIEHIDKVIDIDQSPIGRTPRSNPATYVGCFTPIREWFAAMPEAKSRGYSPGRFSFNVKGGRCEACQGDGVVKIEMHFLPDVYVECDQCHGKRYNRETLEITYKHKNIADILDMTVEEGADFFESNTAIIDKLKALKQVGLGYIKIGQQATTLSGGEAQRIKLAKELSRRATGKTLYILDEPTTGLHFEDIRKLLEVLHHLVDQGNTVLVIEHNLEVIKTADWIIDMGPEGGDKGGEIVATGTPEEVAEVAKSYTGKYLKPHLKTRISSMK
jgi:excinuclease ABC subunit A